MHSKEGEAFIVQETIKNRKGTAKPKEQWGSEVEFLLSCIALSVGLGNIWRFPFIAFQNGGGAFVIPYLIVLLIIGRPIYYLEILIGQFTGQGALKSFAFAPALKGIAAGQIMATGLSMTYYSCIMALTFRFLVASFSTYLPWSYCRDEWGDLCLNNNSTNQSETIRMSPAELYFQNEIIQELSNIEDGIGWPKVDLVACVAVSWLIIGTVLVRGIKSSGKAAYVLGIFPYVVLVILLLRAVMLPGAIDGIIYFFKPQWKELLNPVIWYAAVTQVFFSLAICFGTLITYASYNHFNRNVSRDIIIITTMDSCSSLIAGCITFGMLGNLAFQTGVKDIGHVVKGGVGLAFVSYPDAIFKFEFAPQAFAVLFFLMLFVLGVGSTVGMGSCIIRTVCDQFQGLSNWKVVLCLTVIGFGVSLVYVTPGGQFILNLVDYYGVSFTALIFAIAELVAVGWIYGIRRFCSDIEFMTGQKPGVYWRICWGIIAPALMILVLVYTLLDMKPLTYKNVDYPPVAQIFGWILTVIIILQLPGWAIFKFLSESNQDLTCRERLVRICQPEVTWGPLDSTTFEDYVQCNKRNESNYKSEDKNIIRRIFDNLFA